MKHSKYKHILVRVKLCLISILSIVLVVGIIGPALNYKSQNKGTANLATIKDKKPDLVILIEIDKKTLFLIDKASKELISTYSIASGKDTSPTPLGNFQIVKKSHWGEGFGTRWLGLNVPWGIYGIHGTNKPGSIGLNASAGCIRMRNHDIEELYDIIPLNTNVLIRNGEYGPFGNGFRVLKPGDTGSDVVEVQKRLNQSGFYLSEIDGIYGDGMKKSLIEFLIYKNLPLTDKIDKDLYKELGIILMD